MPPRKRRPLPSGVQLLPRPRRRGPERRRRARATALSLLPSHPVSLDYLQIPLPSAGFRGQESSPDRRPRPHSAQERLNSAASRARRHSSGPRPARLLARRMLLSCVHTKTQCSRTHIHTGATTTFPTKIPFGAAIAEGGGRAGRDSCVYFNREVFFVRL